MYESFLTLLDSLFSNKRPIALHEPSFIGHEKEYVAQCIDSTFVSSIGAFVTKTEQQLAKQFDVQHAILVSSGTAALHLCLIATGITPGDEVITQPLTFVATSNAITYCQAFPVFIDIHEKTLGLCPYQLEQFLEKHTAFENGQLINQKTGRPIRAVLPMHTFGHPCHLDELQTVCKRYQLPLIEDCAEGFGSTYKNKPLGSFGLINAVSFNGNKIVTAGGGGAILTNDDTLARRVKHLSTTAKKNHAWHIAHDETGFNYRMPNLNAALLFGQIENIDAILSSKRALAFEYAQFFEHVRWAKFMLEPEHAHSNYWLNTLIFDDEHTRDDFLNWTNERGIMTRPAWTLMPDLPMFESALCEPIEVARYHAKRLVNIPSSARCL